MLALIQRRRASRKYSMSPKGRQTRRKYIRRNYSRVLETNRRWKKNNRYKINAHARVLRAIKKGKLKRKSCRCGKRKVDAHHPDYKNPLRVVWLCRTCHGRQHRKK